MQTNSKKLDKLETKKLENYKKLGKKTKKCTKQLLQKHRENWNN